MTSSVETRKKKKKKAAADPPIWLFRKQLNVADVNVALGQLVVEECCEEMKMVLMRLIRQGRSLYLRVIATDPNGGVYELRLMKIHSIDTHIFYHQWSHVVAANTLNTGDSVDGWGNIVDGGGEVYVTCSLYFRRQKPGSSRSRKRISPGNQDAENKRGGDGVEKSKSLGGIKKIRTREEEEVTSSERKRGSSPANQESEEVYVDITGDGYGGDGKKPEPILEGENPKKKESPAESCREGKHSASSENQEMVDDVVEESEYVGGNEKMDTAWEEAIKQCIKTLKMGLRVSIKDPDNQLKFTCYVPQGSNNALCNGLKVGDSVVMKNEDAEKQNLEEAMEIKSPPFLLFDVNSDVGQLVKKIVEREERKKGYGGFARFRAEDKKGVEYQWREVVAANGAMSDDAGEFLLKMVRFG